MEVFFIKQELLINEQIRFSEVQVISDDGEKLGVMKTNAALDLAVSKDLDLVLVAPNNKPAVCKIMNYGKYKFEQAKKEKEAKKNKELLKLRKYVLLQILKNMILISNVKMQRNLLRRALKLKLQFVFVEEN